jgi:hypothetical protein
MIKCTYGKIKLFIYMGMEMNMSLQKNSIYIVYFDNNIDMISYLGHGWLSELGRWI